jgi:PAS domain S-box-containing protein
MTGPGPTSPEQIQVFYEIALSIGRGDTVEEVAQTALSSYLRRLNCSTGAVFERRTQPDGTVSYDLVAGVPRNPSYNRTFQVATDHLPDGDDAAFRASLPVVGSHDGTNYYLFGLPGFGLLVVVKSGQPFSAGTRAALVPLHERLGDACAGRNAEQEVRRTRQTLRAVIDTIPQEVFLKDADGTYTMANEATAASFGVRVAELEGATDREYVHGSEHRDPSETDQRVIESGEPVSLPDERLVDVDGRTRTVTTDIVPISVGDTDERHALVVATDTTERVEREAAIERTNTVLRTILDSLPAGVLVEDPNRDILAINQRLLDLLGVPTRAEMLVGNDCAAAAEGLKHLFADPKGFTDRVEELITRREPVRNEPLELADGRRLERDYVPYELPDGEASLWAYRDVTERAEREAELRTVRQQLRQSNEELEQFAYAASHDLKEPLRTVANYLTLLETLYDEGSTLDARALDLVANAVGATGRMQAMIDALLYYSRIDGQGGEFSPIDLDTVVEKAQLNLTVRLDEADAVVTSDPLPTVSGDGRLLVQLFQNLVDNAVKYNDSTPPTVHVEARPVDEDEVPESVSVDWTEQWCLVTVEDNGVGMNPAAADRAFDVFERLGRTDGEGIGMGLTLCQRIVSVHDGTVWVSSTPGEGTRVNLLLPLAESTDED